MQASGPLAFMGAGGKKVCRGGVDRFGETRVSVRLTSDDVLDCISNGIKRSFRLALIAIREGGAMVEVSKAAHSGNSDALPEVDQSRLDATRALFDLPFDKLAERAGVVSNCRASCLKQPRIGASPIILTGACATNPPCRHCKWSHFKAAGMSSFVVDATDDEIAARARSLASQGVRRAFTATGWLGYRLPLRFIRLVSVAHEAAPELELYGLFGALDRESHSSRAAAGLTGMLTSLESPSKVVYDSFRPGGDTIADRLHALDYAREAGLKIWSGFLVGLGETAEDCAYGIELLRLFEPESISILPFEPFPDTPMANHAPTDSTWLARVNAVARVALPNVDYFFADSSKAFAHSAFERLGLNGLYETNRR